MQPVNDAPARPDRHLLRRYGPVAAVMAVVAALVASQVHRAYPGLVGRRDGAR